MDIRSCCYDDNDSETGLWRATHAQPSYVTKERLTRRAVALGDGGQMVETYPDNFTV